MHSGLKVPRLSDPTTAGKESVMVVFDYDVVIIGSGLEALPRFVPLRRDTEWASWRPGGVGKTKTFGVGTWS